MVDVCITIENNSKGRIKKELSISQKLIVSKFYLETNSLYSIKKIDKAAIANSFTSALALFEIISNITLDKYVKRKSIIQSVLHSEIFIDWRFPQEIILNSFDYFEGAILVDKRIEHLKTILSLVLKTSSFEELQTSSSRMKYGLEYFKKMDRDLGIGFVSSYMFYNLLKLVTPDNKEITQSSISEAHKRNLTISALAHMLQTSFPDFVEDEDDLDLLIKSYNGGVDIHVEFFSNFCLHKFIENEQPAKNDFIDLGHLFYLNDNMHIVSDDNLFEKLGIKSIKTQNLVS